MTEFEMAYLLTDMQSAMASQTATFFTGVSGFLASGYVAAHRLNRTMLVVVLSLYTVWFAPAVFILSRMGISFTGLLHQIHEYAAAGKGLQWHAAATAIAPEWLFEMGPYPTYIFGVVVYCGTVYFFLHCRRMNHKAECGAWHPKV